MRVALDTDVLVSAFKTPLGPCDQVLEEAICGGIQVCYDTRVLEDYKGVLSQAYMGFELFSVRLVLARLAQSGSIVRPIESKPSLPDETDRAFLDLAQVESVDCLVTGDPGRYPVEARQGAVVLGPEEFLVQYRKAFERP